MVEGSARPTSAGSAAVATFSRSCIGAGERLAGGEWVRQSRAQFLAVRGETLEILLGGQRRFAPVAELVLRLDQSEDDGPVAGQLRVTLQVVFRPRRHACLEAALQVAV